MEWLETKYLYFYLLLFSMAYPIAQSFEWRLKYYKKWKHLLPGMVIMMVIFIPWDVWFTDTGVWWFNDRYISGIKLFLLPIEEWLFFIIVPFACIFIHEVLKFFIKKDVFGKLSRYILFGFATIVLLLLLLGGGGIYSQVTFSLGAISMILLAVRNPNWAGRFVLTYVVCWLPFLLINGALTGSFTQEAVVNYNPEAIVGFRVLTIPIEDSIYNWIMLLIVVWVYEWRIGKSAQRSS